MITSPEQARDEMFTMVDTVVTGAITTLLTYEPDTRWQGVEKSTEPNVSRIWLRIGKYETDEDRRYVSNSDNSKGVFKHIGLLSIEIFGPLLDMTIYDKLNECGQLVRDAFRNKYSTNKIRFTKAKIIEVPNDNLWAKLNVIIEYEYDEFGDAIANTPCYYEWSTTNW